MTRQEKANIIQNIKTDLDASSSIYITDCSGLDALTTSKLRRACFKSNIRLSIVKNTFLTRAMEEGDKDFGELKSVLKGNTALMYSEVGNAPAKVIKEFRKKQDKPVLKAAFIEESFYFGDDQVELLSTLKSKDELIGEIITLLQSPPKNVISSLQSGGGKLSGILKALSDRVE